MLTRSYTLGRVRGVDIDISVLWVFVAGFLTFTLSQPNAVTQYTDVINALSLAGSGGGVSQLPSPVFATQVGPVLFAMTLVAGLYASVLLHEWGHIYGARLHDISVDKITLWALGGAAQMQSQPESPRKEFALTIAGPLVSATLAVGFVTLGAALATQTDGILTVWVLLIGLFNLGIALFNLVPAFPLDGGRILRSVLATVFDYKRGTRYATTVAAVSGISTGIISALSLSLAGFVLSLFVLYTSLLERKRVLSPSPDAITSPDSLSVTADTQSTLSSPPTDDSSGGGDGTSPSRILSEELLDGSPHPIRVTESEFVFWTGSDIPDETLTAAVHLLTNEGATVTEQVTSTTDYIVIPDGTVGMYKSSVDSAELTLISATAMGAVFEAISGGE